MPAPVETRRRGRARIESEAQEEIQSALDLVQTRLADPFPLLTGAQFEVPGREFWNLTFFEDESGNLRWVRLFTDPLSRNSEFIQLGRIEGQIMAGMTKNGRGTSMSQAEIARYAKSKLEVFLPVPPTPPGRSRG